MNPRRKLRQQMLIAYAKLWFYDGEIDKSWEVLFFAMCPDKVHMVFRVSLSQIVDFGHAG